MSTSRRRPGPGNFDAWRAGPPLPAPRSDASVDLRRGQDLRDRRQGRRRRPDDDGLRPLAEGHRTGRVGRGHRGPAAPRGALRHRGRRRWPTASCSSAARTRPVRSPRSSSRRSTPAASSASGRSRQALAPAAVRRGGGRRGRLRLAVRRSRRERSRSVRSSAGPSGSRRPKACRRTPTRASSSSGRSANVANLPAARDDPAAWAVNGVLYVAGGDDGDRARRTSSTGRRRPRTATSPSGSTSTSSDLPVAQSGGAAVVNGPDATIVGGQTADAVLDSSLRGNIAPQAPFFRLGSARDDRPGAHDRG